MNPVGTAESLVYLAGGIIITSERDIYLQGRKRLWKLSGGGGVGGNSLTNSVSSSRRRIVVVISANRVLVQKLCKLIINCNYSDL